MSGQDFNPCECIWGHHELTMRRILNIIRNSQSVCTDNECYDVSQTANNNNLSTQNTLFLTVLFVIAFFFFALRPRAQRIVEPATKPSGNNGGNGNPPSPTIF